MNDEDLKTFIECCKDLDKQIYASGKEDDWIKDYYTAQYKFSEICHRDHETKIYLSGSICGHKYAIGLNSQFCPVAYVQIDRKTINFFEAPFQLTYAGFVYWEDGPNPDEYFIGWGHAYSGDYIPWYPENGGHRYSLQEMLFEVAEMIDAIIDKELHDEIFPTLSLVEKLE